MRLQHLMKGLVLLLLCQGLMVLAQPASVETGDPVTVTITDDSPIAEVTFTGSAGELVYMVIFATQPGEDIEGHIRLNTADGLMVQEVFESRLGPLLLPVDGEYRVQIAPQDWEEFTGDVTLFLESTQLTPLEDTEVMDSWTQRGAMDFYTFEAEAGDLYRYALDCSQCGINLTTPSGERFLSDGFYDSPAIPLLELPETGLYRMTLQTMSDNIDYQLVFTPVNPVDLPVNEPVSGVITSQEPLLYTFESAAGKTWQLNTQLPATGDRRLRILRTTGREFWDIYLAQDDGSGPDGNPRISPFIAPEDGTYYVQLGYVAYDEEVLEVDYTLTLSPESLVRLATGTPVSDTITPDTGAIRYLYEGTAGETLGVNLTRESETGALNLILLSPEDEVISATSRNASYMYYEVTLPLDGTYQFDIANLAYDPEPGMDFTLLIEPVSLDD